MTTNKRQKLSIEDLKEEPKKVEDLKEELKEDFKKEPKKVEDLKTTEELKTWKDYVLCNFMCKDLIPERAPAIVSKLSKLPRDDGDCKLPFFHALIEQIINPEAVLGYPEEYQNDRKEALIELLKLFSIEFKTDDSFRDERGWNVLEYAINNKEYFSSTDKWTIKYNDDDKEYYNTAYVDRYSEKCFNSEHWKFISELLAWDIVSEQIYETYRRVPIHVAWELMLMCCEAETKYGLKKAYRYKGYDKKPEKYDYKYSQSNISKLYWEKLEKYVYSSDRKINSRMLNKKKPAEVVTIKCYETELEKGIEKAREEHKNNVIFYT